MSLANKRRTRAFNYNSSIEDGVFESTEGGSEIRNSRKNMLVIETWGNNQSGWFISFNNRLI